jgi:hypothetical protein
MADESETVLGEAWRRASRRRRWYALAAVLVLVAVTALVAVVTHHSPRRERALPERTRPLLVQQSVLQQRALAVENLAMQARLQARAAAKLP